MFVEVCSASAVFNGIVWLRCLQIYLFTHQYHSYLLAYCQISKWIIGHDIDFNSFSIMCDIWILTEVPPLTSPSNLHTPNGNWVLSVSMSKPILPTEILMGSVYNDHFILLFWVWAKIKHAAHTRVICVVLLLSRQHHIYRGGAEYPLVF